MIDLLSTFGVEQIYAGPGRLTPGSGSMYYNDGFLSAGGAQTDSFWSAIGQLGSTAITAAFQPRPSFGQLPPTTTVPSSGPPVMSSHPVIGAAGQGATAVSPVYGPTMGQGGHGRYYPPGTKGTHQVRRGPHAGSWVRNRHRNVCNPRALRRAISRAHGFAKLAMKTIHLIHPRKKVHFGGFRKRKRT